MRAKLDGKTGRRFWKNLDELAETPAFHELMARGVSAAGRRGRVGGCGEPARLPEGDGRVAGAGRAGGLHQAAGRADLSVCEAPEDLILGKPMYFATAYPFPTGAIPVLVKSDAFRPIKVDGNPEHPMSKGKSDAFTQATLLDLYDPDRSQHVLHRGQAASWGEFQEAFAAAAKKTTGGQGLYFLSETITSPTLAAQWKQVQAKYPQAKLVQWEPVNRDSSRWRLRRRRSAAIRTRSTSWKMRT